MADNKHNSPENNQVEYDASDIICDALAPRDQRALIFHLLYAADAFDYETSLSAIVDNFARGFGMVIPQESQIFKQAQEIINQRDMLDGAIFPLLANWRFDRLGTATRLILRLSIWELLYTNIDRVIIINEAIELAKCFAERDAFKFINGILDEYTKREQSISLQSA